MMISLIFNKLTYFKIQDWVVHLKLAPHNPIKALTLELGDVDKGLNFLPRNDYDLLQQSGFTCTRP